MTQTFRLCFLLTAACYGQWQTGPNAPITCIAVRGDTVYAGTEMKGVYRSHDRGDSWSHIGLLEKFIYSITAGPFGLYVHTGDRIMHSSNQGATWREADSGLNPQRGTTLASDGVRTIFWGMGGLYTDSRGIGSWSKVGNGLPDTLVYCFAGSGALQFAGTEAGVFRSQDGGATWVQANQGLGQDSVVSSLAIEGSRIYAAAQNGVYRCDNPGRWTQVGQGLPVDSNQISQIAHLAVSGSQVLARYWQNLGVYHSLDSGNSWAPLASGVPSHLQNAIAAAGADVWLGTEEGILVSHDRGATWLHSGFTPANASIRQFASWSGSLFAGTFQGVYRTRNLGLSWDEVNQGLPPTTQAPVKWLSVSDGRLLATSDSGIFQWNDLSLGWSRVSRLPGSVSAPLIRGGRIDAGTFGGIFRSADSGATWQKTRVGDSLAMVQCLFDHEMGFLAGGDGIFRSGDGGVTWTKARASIGSFPSVGKIEVQGKTFFAATSSGLFKSSDSGYYWERAGDLSQNWEAKDIRLQGREIFVSTYGKGVFQSSDSGKTLTPINTGLLDTITLSLGVQSNFLFAGTLNQGIWRRPLRELGIPTSLFQPQAVPASPRFGLWTGPGSGLRVEFALQHPSWVEISVFNPEGRKLAVLKADFLDSGTHRMLLDAGRLSKGVYFLRLDSDQLRLARPFTRR